MELENKVPEQLDSIKSDNLKALQKLFPSVIKDGQLDLEALKEEIGNFEEVKDLVEKYFNIQERYKESNFEMTNQKCFYILFTSLLSSLCSGIEYLLLKERTHFGSLANYYTDAICLNME